MNTRTKRLPVRFAQPARFAAPFVPAAPFRGAVEGELEELKNRLLKQELQKTAIVELNVLLRRAANDAASLVWLTPYPLWLLPALFEEKARTARAEAGRQARIRQRSSGLISLAE